MPDDALIHIKRLLADTYRRRERRRSIAGLATIAAILSTLLLVGTTFAHYVVTHAIEGAVHGRL